MPDEQDHGGHSHAGAGHAGHAHRLSADADTGKLTIALALIVSFMAVEVVVGVLAHWLALLSDAATCSPTPPQSASPSSRRGSPRARRKGR